ncbi:MAG: cytochrome c oxidase subunit II [Candidatus Poseidoniales archaeon]|nr:cytochrome c oxidase subunit II [Candidatus Poseidoniales archaeon]RJV00125.1 MAG: cytochrome c oxidase subunit II [Candidatus Poseidoniales archaeon]
MGASRELWPDEYTVFNILYDKFLFWSIVVGLFTFAWLLIAVLRYREGIEPAGKEELKVGTFPKERHHFDLELAWFVGPTILVIWVTILAFGSMNIVWGEVEKLQNDEDSFTVEVNGLQWYWDFYYQDELTWEDMDTGNDVTWDIISGLSINASENAATASVTWGTNTETLDLSNQTSMDVLFNEMIFQSVEILDADGTVIHRWQHIPIEHKMSGDLIIPCDTNVLFNIHSMNPEREANFDATNTYQGVQHAFWLQEWGMKEDAVPGLEGGTWMYVQPNEAGTFPIRCAEYCGKEHSLMYGQVEVVAKEGMTCDADFGIYFDHKEDLE